MNRRGFLGSTTALLAGVAGCLSGDSSTGPQTTGPENPSEAETDGPYKVTTTTENPASIEVEKWLSFGEEVQYNDARITFTKRYRIEELEVDGETVPIVDGDMVACELRVDNRSDEKRSSLFPPLMFQIGDRVVVSSGSYVPPDEYAPNPGRNVLGVADRNSEPPDDSIEQYSCYSFDGYPPNTVCGRWVPYLGDDIDVDEVRPLLTMSSPYPIGWRK